MWQFYWLRRENAISRYMITIDARMRSINAVDFLIISHSPPYIRLFTWNVVFFGFLGLQGRPLNRELRSVF
jgi:hypothetical protein